MSDPPPASRIDRVRERIDDLGLDALLITTPSNRRWLSGFTGSTGALLIDRDRALFATDSRYWEQVGQQAPHFTLVRVEGASMSTAPQLLEEAEGGRLGFEPAGMTVDRFEQWQRSAAALPEGRRPALVPAPAAVEQLRMVKEPAELEAIRRAVLLGDDAFRTPPLSRHRA